MRGVRQIGWIIAAAYLLRIAAVDAAEVAPILKVPEPPMQVRSLSLSEPPPKVEGATVTLAAKTEPPRFTQLKRLTEDELANTATASLAAQMLRGNDRTLILDFPDIQIQGRMLARIILFVERLGTPKTRIMSVQEVQQWLSRNAATLSSLTVGNNLRATDLSRFFNTASFQGEPLTVDEQRLLELLLQLEVLRREESGTAVIEPEVIVLSVPQVSRVEGCATCAVSLLQRRVILEHELAHARFFTNSAYQSYALWFWSHALDIVTRSKFTNFLRSRGYDSANRELMANEMQAFLMHTPDVAMFDAAFLGVTAAELAKLRQSFTAGMTPKQLAAPERPYRLE